MEAIFASISSQLGIRKRLVRRLNQPMTARLINTARSLKIPHEIGQILFPAVLPFRLPLLLCKKHEGMISLVKRCHMMCHVKNYQSCLHSTSNVWGKKRQQKAKRDNNKQKTKQNKTKQKIKTNKRKQRSFLSVYFSLGAAG